MATLQELDVYLEDLLQCGAFKDYSPNGIQIEGKQQVDRLATAVTASLATIQAAVEAKADALLVHHGIFWNGDPYLITGTKREKMRLLLDNNISLLAYHLPLDAHHEVGNNWKAARDMGWTDLEPCFALNGMFIGVKGRVSALPLKEFTQQVEEYYEHPAYTALGGDETINRVGLLSGGGYKCLQEAAREGLDAFITGNFDEPAWHQAHEEKINFYAVGHSASERVGPHAIGNHLATEFRLDATFLDLANPF